MNEEYLPQSLQMLKDLQDTNEELIFQLENVMDTYEHHIHDIVASRARAVIKLAKSAAPIPHFDYRMTSNLIGDVMSLDENLIAWAGHFITSFLNDLEDEEQSRAILKVGQMVRKVHSLKVFMDGLFLEMPDIVDKL